MANLTEWHPFGDFAELRNRLDEVFREITNGERRGLTPSDRPGGLREGPLRPASRSVPGIDPEEMKMKIERAC